MNRPLRALRSGRPWSLGALLLGLTAACDPAADAPLPPAAGSDTLVAEALDEARRHLRAGRPKEAAAASERGLAADSTHLELANLLATVEAGRGRYAPAIAAIERALRHHPESPLLHLNLGAMHFKLGDFDKAEQYLLEAARRQPDHSSVHRRLAELYLASDRPAGAIRHAHRAAELFPGDGTLTYYVGRAFEEAGQSDSARAWFRRAADLDPGFTEAWYRLAVLSRRAGDRAEADSALTRFRRLQSIGDGDPDVPKQLDKLRAAVLDAPEDGNHQFALGAFFAEHGYVDEAVNRLRRAARLRPGDTRLLNDSGRLLARRRAHAEALRFYRASIETDSTQVEPLVAAGTILTLERRLDEALDALERALARDPDSPVARLYHGIALLEAGRADEAADTLRRALAQSPAPALRAQLQRVLAQAAKRTGQG